MPQPPYTWPLDGFLTATLLNQELRRYSGDYYLANGVGFHANRPVYKSAMGGGAAPSAPPANTWESAYNPGQWLTVADTATWMGGRGDVNWSGVFSGTFLQTGGGAAQQYGGLGIVTGSAPFATSGTAAALKAGIGLYSNTTPVSQGTIVMTNNTYSVVPWALDVVDMNTSPSSLFYETTAAGMAGTANENDGSGYNWRLQGFWASVYPANGTTVSSVPSPFGPWTNSSRLTSSQFNGSGGIVPAMNLLNMPPLLRVQATVATTIGTATTTVSYSSPSGLKDTYGKLSGNAYTVPLTGIYLVYTAITAPSSNTVTGNFASGVGINLSTGGTAYFGPMNQLVNGQPTGAAKVQIFALNSGDVITHVCQASAATACGVGSSAPVMIVYYLGAQGAPGTLPTVPDTSYLFAAGTPGSQMASVLNSHMSNDLQFLLQRPYCMAYQSVAQTTVPMGGSGAILVCDTAQSNVHGTTGTNYGGWTSGVNNEFTAPRSGWYLCVTESFLAAPTLTSAPCFASGFYHAGTGVSNYDYYGKQNAAQTSAGGTYGGGAASVGIYFLRAGDTIAPFVWANSCVSSGDTSTFVASGQHSHFEAVWLAS